MATNNLTVVRRYSRAVFELAKQRDILVQVNDDLTQLADGISSQADFVTFMESPAIKLSVKQDLVNQLIAGANELSQNLIKMLFDAGRITQLGEVVAEFKKLYDQDQKIVRAIVTTAIELDATQKQRLADKFAQVVGAKEVILTPVIDESIVGGVILQSSDYIYDGSIKTRIERVKRLLLK
ncbi:ATP synthase F1 subunit delta [Ligilactobacillus equi]|uniref:ATP synthase subunit delta n=2 Tax=Ligilactobacillus equi TaxID=137357 RepID=V7I187_9LACO|nr:ATP synthase F1 subunit delta [Ligilactobacillus equi]ETA75036.1 ATP synthase delta chain [Ligilactobacillus equi DPC 6820]KRL79355.1 ATP synthase delta chain [Ligilactobacillus equi DSM 15833 = JCM 10991]